MAEVFAGHSVGDHGFQKPVAIKRLLPELANDEVFVERLIEEAKLLVGMQHGNIVSVLDLAREGDDVFLVMEFVDGPSLRQLIKSRGPRGLSLGVATYIVQSAAAGLEFAHVRPGGAIIHADISPSNLLLTTSGEVRVADFGIARREGLGQGVVEGKWAYMAPEQARGESLTPRSDVFALGVVLYELLTGQHPFGRVVTAHQRDEQMQVIPPRVVKPSIPPGLDAMCMRALSHDPRARYGRMQQLIDALVEERFANGYREGASDLAQAIREVTPKSEIGAPRTMHTERPLTIVTRSLLPEVPPARPSRPGSQPHARPSSAPPERASSSSVRPSTTPSSREPQYPMGLSDPPPRDAFPLQPTAVATRALPLASTTNELVAVPPSGEHTAARTVDQLALAQAANAAAAMLQQHAMFQPQALPSPSLRADGTPLPPFRMSHAALGDELASVVGGHTATGHGAGVAVDPRHRWTFAVLGVAALLGVAAAVAIQLNPGKLEEAQVAQRPQVAVPSTPVEPAPIAPPIAPPIRPTLQPTIPDPRPEAAASPGTAVDASGTPGAPGSEPGSAVDAPRTPDRDDTLASPGTPGPGGDTVEATRDRDPAPQPGEARAATRRLAPSREAGKRKVEPGTLRTESKPWSWVTVGGQTKATPDRFLLAPGTYQVTFRTDEGLVKVEHVTIESGKVRQINERMDL